VTILSPVDLDAIVSHILPVERAQRVMCLARTRAGGAIKVLLSFE